MTNPDILNPIYKDIRGEIHFFIFNGEKFHVLLTKSGMLRSGDYHPDTQYDIILKGELEVTTRQNEQDVVKKYKPNELIVIPPNIPHIFRSLTDSIIIEWREKEYKAEYYKPYRKLIEEQLKELKK